MAATSKAKPSPPPLGIELERVGRWGRQPLYAAKVGTFGSTVIMVKRARKFYVGQRIQYCATRDTEGMATSCTPPWRGGIITEVNGERLHVTKF